MPMSSGLSNGRYGSGAAEPSEATLATSVQSQRPAARTAAALVRYASGSIRTGQTRAVAGRGRSSSSAAGTASQPSHGQALAKSPHCAVTARPSSAPTSASVIAPSACIACAAGFGPERRGEAQDEARATAKAIGHAHQPPPANGLASTLPRRSRRR